MKQKTAEERKTAVLVVDDEPAMRDVIASDLDERGFATVQAASGVEALEKLKSSAFDVVVSDLAMPGLDGLGLLAAMREQDYVQPFIILTGYGDKEASIRALRLGAFDFIEKPVSIARLASIVQEASDYHAAQIEMLEFLEQRVGPVTSALDKKRVGSLAKLLAVRHTTKHSAKTVK